MNHKVPWAYIGSRTTRERNARGEGITACRVRPDGSLEVVQVLGGLANPSYLAVNRQGTLLYTVHGDGDGCSVLSIDPNTGRLTLVQTGDFGLRNPVHLALDASERRLAVSSHLSGELVIISLDHDGRLGGVVQRLALPGVPGPHRREQSCSKPHFNPFDPSGRFVVVPDKGLDRVFVFRQDEDRMAPATAPFAIAREGSGPRGAVFHPSRPWLYVVNELDCTVTACKFDPADGALTPFQWLPLPPDNYFGDGRAAGIVMSRDGRTLYTSVRGCNTIEVFSVDPEGGRLTHRQSCSTEGRTPRFITLHPGGHCLYALNEDSDTVVTIAVDHEHGLLGPSMSTMKAGSPVCMVFGVAS